MRALLEYLDRHSRTLTVYDYTGPDAQLRTVANWLHSYGVHVETVESDGSTPGAVAVLHREGEILGTCPVESLLARADVENAFDADRRPEPALLSELSASVAVKPGSTVREMVRVSREFERRALREGSGELHAGFQQLSQLAGSSRTMEMYTALAREEVDVRVYGSPNATLEDVPFTVVEDRAGELERHWFLLYDGGGNPQRKAALVSEERPAGEEPLPGTTPAAQPDAGPPADAAETAAGPSGSYESYFTTDPDTVDELFALARDAHGELLGPSG